MSIDPLPEPHPVTIPTRDGGVFPIRRVYCIGRNYADHAREMGGDPSREPPFFFMKPADAVMPVAEGEIGRVPYPPLTDNLHHEVELVVAIGRGGRDIAPEHAWSLVWGFAVGLDMTRRDRQAEAKDAGRPWDIAKGFDASAPIGPLVSIASCGRMEAGEIALSVNETPRQRGDLSDMTHGVPEILAELSRWSALAPGDLVMTGTPAGVGAVSRGDRLHATIRGLPALDVVIV